MPRNDGFDIMYAIIREGLRQLKVEQGQEVEIDCRTGLNPGDKVTFDQVLALGGEAGLKIGRPTVAGASVTAEVIGKALGEKIVIQKFRRRKNSRRHTGYRQVGTRVRISAITV
jgi:large subunit ribosomal protein L21